MFIEQFLELSIVTYGLIAIGRALLIDLDDEPGKYAGISWLDKKINLLIIGVIAIIYGGALLWFSCFNLNPPSLSVGYLCYRAGKVLFVLFVGDFVGIFCYDKYLKKKTLPQHGGSMHLTDDEDTLKIEKAEYPQWMRVVFFIMWILVFIIK